LQTVLGVVYFNETKTLLWWISNFLILIGATFYAFVRNQEMDKEKNRVINKENEAKI